MKSKITLKEIWKTIHSDLIGKDSHRGITLTYGWMANQVGHFALGFIPTFFVYSFTQNVMKSFLYVACFWLLFETYNAMSPLYKKEYKGNGSFKPKWGNLTFDTFTDLCFFWLGGFSFFLFTKFDQTLLYILLIAVCGLLFSVRYWFLTKLFQQNAFFPFQFRLSQWNAPIDSGYITTLNSFIKELPQQKHFLVFGSKGKGKTTLMVGLANEIAIKHKKCYYTTFSKWVTLLQEDDQTLTETSNSLWNWSNSDLILIDDINPGTPFQANKCTSENAYSYVMENFPERNSKALKHLDVAWIIGSCAPEDTKENWIEMLVKLEIDRENIFIIDLDQI